MLILNGEFEEAYRNGIVIEFPDGISCHVFPQFYCYSADYPEKSADAPICYVGMAADSCAGS